MTRSCHLRVPITYCQWINKQRNLLHYRPSSWATQSKEVQALRVFQFRCLRTILKINVMHKISRATILEMCQVQDIIQTMDLRRARWIKKLSHMDFTRCPRLLFGCWLYGRVHHRDSKPLKTIGHSHTDSLKRIGEASFLEDGVATIAPFVKKAGSITVAPRTCPLFQLVQSEAWPSMMEKYLGLEPGTYAIFKPMAPGQMPPRRSRAAIAIEPSTPSNDRGPAVCGNCRCVDCLGPPCLSPLSQPPLCNSCGFRHGPTYTQCSLITTNENNAVITEPFTADDVEVAVNELSPRSTQSIYVRLGNMSPRNSRPMTAHHSGLRLISRSACAALVNVKANEKHMFTADWTGTAAA